MLVLINPSSLSPNESEAVKALLSFSDKTKTSPKELSKQQLNAIKEAFEDIKSFSDEDIKEVIYKRYKISYSTEYVQEMRPSWGLTQLPDKPQSLKPHQIEILKRHLPVDEYHTCEKICSKIQELFNITYKKNTVSHNKSKWGFMLKRPHTLSSDEIKSLKDFLQNRPHLSDTKLKTAIFDLFGKSYLTSTVARCRSRWGV